MNKTPSTEVASAMRLLLFSVLILSAPSLVGAQSPTESANTRSDQEIPEDMPPPPESAPPAEAPAVDGTEDRPPHPQTPAPLEEAQPSTETLSKTVYHWLPGHWVWTGEQFEWRSGSWVYKVKDMILVPPRWEWTGKQWLFHDAGWAKPGTTEVVYRTTPAPGGPDAVTNPEQPPGTSKKEPEPERATTTVYVWTGVYVAPLVLFPIWHPWYHYHWYRRHPAFRRPPAYRSRRYTYARTHRRATTYRTPSAGRSPSAGQPLGSGRQPSSGRPSQAPSTRPSPTPSSKGTSTTGASRGSSRGSTGRRGGRRGGRR